MVLISVTPSEARKLDGPGDVITSRDYIDYSDRKAIPITIPDFSYKETNGEKYVVCCYVVFSPIRISKFSLFGFGSSSGLR